MTSMDEEDPPDNTHSENTDGGNGNNAADDGSGATQAFNGLNLSEADIGDHQMQNANAEVIASPSSSEVATGLNGTVVLNADVIARQQQEQADLHEQCIKDARKNAMGEMVLSAEPLNYFQGVPKVPFGYMTITVGVFFKAQWTSTSPIIKNLIENDIGF